MWAKCSTHGPVQDAVEVLHGKVSALWCSCGLKAEAYEPDTFVDLSELKELAKTGKQPGKGKAKAVVSEDD